MNKKYLIFISIFFFIFIYILANLNFFEKKSSQNKTINTNKKTEITTKKNYSSNKMNEVSYSSKDPKGNEYTVKAKQAEIDISNRNILYLEDVSAVIKLKNSEKIYIFSDYGKYNSNNFDTIFSKNVIVNYLYNKITSGYLDFSFQRNSMIISKNVIYKDLESILKADVMEMNIKTKDTKIYMLEDKKRVSIKNKN